MYRPTTSAADRVATLTGVVLIHVGLILALLNLSGRIDLTTTQPNLKIFDVNAPPPPPPIEPPPPRQASQKPKPKDEAGKAAPENIKSKPTEIKRPEPKVVVPAKPPVVTAPVPGTGSQATQGAGQNPGPGTGAGGIGNGTGSGAGGNGGGGGGGGGIGTPSQIVRKISGGDYPPAVRSRWPRGGRIFTRLRIEADGRVSQCDVMRSFGDPLADQWTCALIRQRAAFRPATDRAGRPIASWFGYVQAAF